MKRTPVDRHYSPPGLFEALVPLLGIRRGETVLMCSGGHGAPIAALEAVGAIVYAVDIDPEASIFKRLPAERTLLGDFLELGENRPEHWPAFFDYVVDNPPFSLLDGFLAVAIRHARRIALVVRSTWVEARFRVEEFLRLGNPRVLMPSPRPPYRTEGGGTDTAPTFFVFWDQVPRKELTLELVRWKRARGQRRPLLHAVHAAVETPWWPTPPGVDCLPPGTQLALVEEATP